MKIAKSDIDFRQGQILESINKNGYRKVEDLAREFGISVVTVRRDLICLENQKLIKRFHGGAQVAFHAPKWKLDGRDLNLVAHIAEKAAEYVENKDTVFLNSGMTTYAVLQKIKKNIVAVTSNACAVDLDLSDSPVKLIFTGGELSEERETFLGQFTISLIDLVTADKCFLGVNAISAEGGLTSSSVEKIMINNRMLERCKGPKIVVTEGNKIGKTTNFHVCPVTKITHLITDNTAPPTELDKIRRAGVEVIIA